MAEYKNKLFNEYISKPFTIGENIKVRKGLFLSHTNNPKQYVSATIIDEVGDGLYKVKLNKSDGYGYGKDVTIKILEKQYVHKDLSRVGSNPFQNIDFWRKLERVNYDMCSILNCLGIHPTFKKEECNIDLDITNEYTGFKYELYGIERYKFYLKFKDNKVIEIIYTDNTISNKNVTYYYDNTPITINRKPFVKVFNDVIYKFDGKDTHKIRVN